MAQRVYRGRTIVIEYEPDKVGIARCAVGAELRLAVGEIARTRALPFAISISPVGGPGDEHRGEYITSFQVINDAHAVIADMRRVAALLINHSTHAAAVEWGNRHTDGHGHRVLGRTLNHLNAGL